MSNWKDVKSFCLSHGLDHKMIPDSHPWGPYGMIQINMPEKPYTVIIRRHKQAPDETCDYYISPTQGDFIGFVKHFCGRYNIPIPKHIDRALKKREYNPE